MKLLLDTHALIWWMRGDPRLSEAAQEALADRTNLIYGSAVSALEISTKFRLGKLPEAQPLAAAFQEQLDAEGFIGLAVQISHGQLAGSFRDRHKDPFDRLLIAQALIEGLVLVSNEAVFDDFGVQRLW